MNRAEWNESITRDCKGIGTYKPEYDSVIDTLAQILERRDFVQAQFIEDGANPVQEYRNQTLGKNPMLQIIDELNSTALKYWRDLGLTPSGTKKLTNETMQTPKRVSFLDKIEELENNLKNLEVEQE